MTIARNARIPFFCRFGILWAILGMVLLQGTLGLAQPVRYQQTNLVSDQPGIALVQDPSLRGAWGIALSATGGAFWVSSHTVGVADLYSGDVSGSAFQKASLTVTIPGGAPTGLVFNSSTDFVVSAGGQSAPAIFIFATGTGTIAGWNPTVPPPPVSSVAVTAVSTPGAVYTGLAIGNNGAGNFLYAADFENGKIDVFNRSFQPTTLAGVFADPGIPRIYRPFNVQNLGGRLFITYAIRGGDGDGVGGGFVSVFDTNGNFLQRLISGHGLAAPWGLALAPTDFGAFSGALLVGNFGNGRIGAYDPTTGAFLGQLRSETRGPIEIDGLLGLAFGNGLTAGDRDTLYFAAGPERLTQGLFGSLRPIASP